MLNFIYTLFNHGEFTCFAKDSKGYRVSPIDKYDAPEFFCINPLDGNMDLNPQKDWHRYDLPRRADHNVTAYRNFMIELDTMDIDKQIDMLNHIDIPYTSLVYSGSKSIHLIISLTKPLSSYDEYKARSEALVNIVPYADKTSKNPSRLSRFPGTIRSDTGMEQELLLLNERVEPEKLDAWLTEMGGLQLTRPRPKKDLRSKNENKEFKEILKDCSHTTRLCVTDPEKVVVNEGDRHHTLKGAVVDLWYSGASADDIHSALQPLEIHLGIDDRGDLERLVEWVSTYL